LIVDVSLKMSASTKQAHISNQESKLINRQSNQRSADPEKLDSFATSFRP
jgi:hypothetical protein